MVCNGYPGLQFHLGYLYARCVLVSFIAINEILNQGLPCFATRAARLDIVFLVGKVPP